ncbi:MAG: hypothetical protein OEY06_09300 [Gammaproteobacteria bacterium]|nr:hypothetical protein [Gammaproteobacteria bacterium]
MAKLQNVSARISQEDAEFLAQVEITGAKTPSDKLRAIIEQARLRHIAANDFESAIASMHDLLSPINRRIRHLESGNEIHSELLVRVIEWLPDIVALIVSTDCNREGSNEDEHTTENLLKLESGVADRVFRLIESVLQISITKQCACYNTDLMRERIEPVIELSEIVKRTHFNN